MAIDFPTSGLVANVTTYSYGQNIWLWTGSAWKKINSVGTQGTTGSQGTQGAQGSQGTAGLQGIQGTQGTRGTQGTTGSQGTQGTQGTTGSQGTEGTQGVQGTQGTTGPVAGSANQVVYKNSSNVASGDSNFTFDGTTLRANQIIGGVQSVFTGTQSVVSGGRQNTASGVYSTVGGGQSNTSSGNYSAVIGGLNAVSNKHGEVSHASGSFSVDGDAQHSILMARRNTTDSTANQALFLNGSSDRLTLPARSSWTFTIKLSAYNTTDDESGWWIFRGGIRRNNSNETVLVGSVISESGVESSLNSASSSVVADDTNDALEIRVTGVANKNIYWAAVVDISQVIGGGSSSLSGSSFSGLAFTPSDDEFTP